MILMSDKSMQKSGNIKLQIMQRVNDHKNSKIKVAFETHEVISILNTYFKQILSF